MLNKERKKIEVHLKVLVSNVVMKDMELLNVSMLIRRLVIEELL